MIILDEFAGLVYSLRVSDLQKRLFCSEILSKNVIKIAQINRSRQFDDITFPH